MGRKGITSDDVIRAYVALLKQGRKPGPTNLRLELGRGSYTTISQHVRRLALRHMVACAKGLASTAEAGRGSSADATAAWAKEGEANRL